MASGPLAARAKRSPERRRGHRCASDPASGLRFLNGLNFSGATFYSSGFPFSPGAGGDLNADLVLNDRLVGTGRNSARLPNFLQTDLRLSRRIGLGRRRAIELLIESENAFPTAPAG